MAANTSTLLLSSEGATTSVQALLTQSKDTCDAAPLSQFISSPQSFSGSKERIVLSVTTKQKESWEAVAGRLLSLLRADGLLIVLVEGSDAADGGGLQHSLVMTSDDLFMDELFTSKYTSVHPWSASFLYAGFITHGQDGLPSELVQLSQQHPELQLGVWKRPKWAIGASSALGGGADDLVDEDALIDTAETYKPMGKGRSDCAARPRACANCTCGRKEEEEAAERDAFKKQLETGAVRSSCGNCYLGDAFRCAGCPYKGLPAFRPGEKVDLSEEAERASAAAAAAAALIGAVADAATAGVSVKKGTNKVTLSSMTDDI